MSDCLIIGGGIIGMLTALELTDAGVRVTLLEKGRTGTESSWAGGGIISPLYPWRYAEPVTALASWSQTCYPQLAERLFDEGGIDPEYTRSGLLILDVEETEQAAAWAQRHHVPLHTVAPEDLPQIEPRLAPQPGANVWMPEVAQIRNPRLVKALRAALEGRVTFEEGCEIRELIVEGGRVTGARSATRRFTAPATLVCAGAWSRHLLGSLPNPPDIAPVCGQMLLFRARAGQVTRIVLKHDRYVIPRRDGRVLVGSTLEHTDFRKETTQKALGELHNHALAMFPTLADCPVEKQWAGLRPGSPGGIPYIAPHRQFEGLFINAGHFRNGVVLGPASARLAADLVLQRRPILDPSPYALSAPRQ